MATCLGWTEFEGCGECIVPLSDSYHMSRLDPDCILYICRELLLTIEEMADNYEALVITRSYSTCSGDLFIYESYTTPTTIQLDIEYNKLIYLYTVGFRAACLKGRIQRKDITIIAESIISINRVYDTDELWDNMDKIYKMLDIDRNTLSNNKLYF